MNRFWKAGGVLVASISMAGCAHSPSPSAPTSPAAIAVPGETTQQFPFAAGQTIAVVCGPARATDPAFLQPNMDPQWLQIATVRVELRQAGKEPLLLASWLVPAGADAMGHAVAFEVMDELDSHDGGFVLATVEGQAIVLRHIELARTDTAVLSANDWSAAAITSLDPKNIHVQLAPDGNRITAVVQDLQSHPPMRTTYAQRLDAPWAFDPQPHPVASR